MDDTGIVSLYWDRNEQAIEKSESKYGGYCHAIAYRILTDQEDADESVNDTWLAAWESTATENNSYQRARRLDAEPITRRL